MLKIRKIKAKTIRGEFGNFKKENKLKIYGKSFNELSFKEGIKIGHRRKPIKKLFPILKNLFRFHFKKVYE